ncbi:MAG: ATP-binding protein [Pseudomonadota bacterium]|nr:ATP-binding protein [Pseudomonadota bacterium]
MSRRSEPHSVWGATATVDTQGITALLVGPVIILAGLNLVFGWLLGSEVFLRGLRDLPAMVPGTALCVAMLGISTLLSQSRKLSIRALSVGLAIGADLFAVLAFVASTGADAPVGGDRMSLATLVAVLCLSAAAVASLVPSLQARRVHEAFATFVIVIALAALIGMVIDLDSLFRFTLFQGLSLPTAISVLLLALAAILRRAQGTWLGVITSDALDGRLARRYLPWAILVPFSLIELSYVMTDRGVMDGRQRQLVFAVFVMIGSCAAVVRLARYQADVARRDFRSEANLRAILSGLDEAIFVLSETGAIMGRNQAAERLFGDRPQEVAHLLSIDLHDVPRRERPGSGRHPVTRALAGEGDVHCGWMDADGHERILGLSSFKPDAAWKVLVIADVTEPWMLQQTAALTERADALAQVVSGVSHEMLNVFGVINMSAGARTDPDDKTAAIILKAAERGSRLAERLQRLTVTQNGAVATVDAGEAALAAVELARRTLPDGIVLTHDPVLDPLPVAASGADLELALLNLILNARNAIAEGELGFGQIDVNVDSEGEQVRIHVIDDGPGVTEEVLERAADPFFTTRRGVGGTGLGLAIISTMARNAGGELRLSSAPGKGFQACLALPRPQLPSTRDQAALPRLGSMRLLVVDPDPEFRAILGDTLEMLGADVHRAGGMEEGCEIAKRLPDLSVLIVEEDLPEAEAQALRRRFPNAGVIYLAGPAQSARKAGWPGLRMGKPVDMALLCNSIHLVAARASGASCDEPL